MKKANEEAVFQRIKRRLGLSRERLERENEVSLCAAIQEAYPELTRGEAMENAARIIRERR